MRGYKNIKIEAFKKDVKSEKELINPLKNVIKEEIAMYQDTPHFEFSYENRTKRIICNKKNSFHGRKHEKK